HGYPLQSAEITVLGEALFSADYRAPLAGNDAFGAQAGLGERLIAHRLEPTNFQQLAIENENSLAAGSAAAANNEAWVAEKAIGDNLNFPEVAFVDINRSDQAPVLGLFETGTIARKSRHAHFLGWWHQNKVRVTALLP